MHFWLLFVMWFVLQGMDIRPPYHIVDMNGGHLWYTTVVCLQSMCNSNVHVWRSSDSVLHCRAATEFRNFNDRTEKELESLAILCHVYDQSETARDHLLMVQLVWVSQYGKCVGCLVTLYSRTNSKWMTASPMNSELMWRDANYVQFHCISVPPCRVWYQHELLCMSQILWPVRCSQHAFACISSSYFGSLSGDICS